jgi:hypothetical protein
MIGNQPVTCCANKYVRGHVLVGRYLKKPATPLAFSSTMLDMGVQYELDNLAKTFKLTYGFETDVWLIPTFKSHFALNRKASQSAEDSGNANLPRIVVGNGLNFVRDKYRIIWRI